VTDPGTGETLPAWARRAMMPPRYRDGRAVSSVPMGNPADIVFGEDGLVAWDRIWGDFCDLALAGGPPHRGTMLSFGDAADVANDPAGYRMVVDELMRAVGLITGWEAREADVPGRIEVTCPSDAAAIWMDVAIRAENVMCERHGAVIQLPAGPTFGLKDEIKNVVTAVAKTFHYWNEHRALAEEIRMRAQP
jgi:sirohydrochlorin cobaltochelatase